AILGAAISGMAHEFGGPTSVYVHGISIIIMVRSATVPAPLGNALGHALLAIAMFPIVFAALYASDPAAHARWLAPGELSLVAAPFLLALAAVSCGAFGSRTSWLAQEQLFQARKLGRYRLQAPIGRGGQGEVWLARDTAAQRNVALKVLRSSQASPA